MSHEAVVSTATNLSKVLICLGECGPAPLEGSLGDEQSENDGDKNYESADGDEKPDPACYGTLTRDGSPACSAVLMEAHALSLAPSATGELIARISCRNVNAF